VNHTFAYPTNLVAEMEEFAKWFFSRFGLEPQKGVGEEDATETTIGDTIQEDEEKDLISLIPSTLPSLVPSTLLSSLPSTLPSSVPLLRSVAESEIGIGAESEIGSGSPGGGHDGSRAHDHRSKGSTTE
jgi:hypothetical protein